MRQWNSQNREKARANLKRCKARNPDSYESSRLKHYFGITLDQYRAMMESQGGVCAVCKRPEDTLTARGKVKKMAVDHCHKTGRVRGLLCQRCNNAIGYAREDAGIIRSILQYLETR
jgi:hypothetical protein